MKYSVTLGSALTIASAFSSGGEARAQERPNILFAFGDDWGRYASIYHEVEGGNTVNALIQTPNIDRVAKEGILFTNAHVTAPQCTPCRSSLLSGQYFWRTERGAILQGAVWNEEIPSYPLILKEHGYHIGRTYKVWFPGAPPNAPYGGAGNTFEPYGNDFNRFSQTVLRHSSQSQIDAEIERLFSEVEGNFQGFLDARPEGQPFCYWWGPWNTHREWARGSGKKLWNIDPDDLIGRLPEGYPDVHEIREDFADYLGEVVAFDHALGLILNKLEEIGELDNTLIVVSGDHGIPGFPRAKSNLYGLGTHVAMAVRYPAMIEEGRIVDDMVNLMDLAPTFLEMGGVDIPEVMTGKSLVPVFAAPGSGMIDPDRNYVVTGFERHVAAARPGNRGYPSRAITKIVDGKQYKYIRNFRPERWPIGTRDNNFPDIDGGPTKAWYLSNFCNPEFSYYIDLAFGKRPYEEFYALEEDPYEVNNLAGDPGHADLKKRLSDKLDEVLLETDDPRMVEGISVFDRYPYTIHHTQ
jgi:arylsulfatase A-like enzyme